MTPGADGRTFSCQYCRAMVQVAIGVDQVAHGLALDLADMDRFLEQLAVTLSEALGELTDVSRVERAVVSVRLSLEKEHFVARRDGARIVAEMHRVSRGITLKRTPLALDRWVTELARALTSLANEDARAAQVLRALGSP